jgi:hypothetical protein
MTSVVLDTPEAIVAAYAPLPTRPRHKAKAEVVPTAPANDPVAVEAEKAGFKHTQTTAGDGGADTIYVYTHVDGRVVEHLYGAGWTLIMSNGDERGGRKLKELQKALRDTRSVPTVKEVAAELLSIVEAEETDESAEKKMAAATKASKKKAKQPTIPIEAAKPDKDTFGHAVATTRFFAYVSSVISPEGDVLHGYTHKDGRALLLRPANESWIVRTPGKTERGGVGIKLLGPALKSTRIVTANVRKITNRLAQEDERKAARVEFIAKQKSERPAGHVLRALEMLKGVSPEFRLDALRGEANYGVRLALMKKLLNKERVLVAETGITVLTQTFYSALGVGEGSAAARLDAFAEKAVTTLAAVKKAASLTRQIDAEARDKGLRATRAERTVPGDIKPMPKKLSKKARVAKEAAEREEVHAAAEKAAAKVAIAPVAKPNVKSLPEVLTAKQMRILKHENGTRSIRMERANSQGAYHVYDNGRCVTGAVMTPYLAQGVKVLDYNAEALLVDLETLLTSKSACTKEIESMLKEAKRVVKRSLEPVVLAVANGVLPTPRPGADEPFIKATDVKLLEDPQQGVVLLQLERANSQGAICVYNNGSTVSVGIVPPETLKTLRQIVDADILKAANQLLNPVVPSVAVTPVAVSHLTAVIHCKEIAAMAKFDAPTKSAAKKSAATEKPAKSAAKKSAAPKAPKTPKEPKAPAADRKITALVKAKDLTLREGTFCYAQVHAAVSSKTVAEAQAKLDADKGNPSKGRKLEIAWMTKKGFIKVA